MESGSLRASVETDGGSLLGQKLKKDTIRRDDHH